jgi:hypothetical protein
MANILVTGWSKTKATARKLIGPPWCGWDIPPSIEKRFL